MSDSNRKNKESWWDTTHVLDHILVLLVSVFSIVNTYLEVYGDYIFGRIDSIPEMIGNCLLIPLFSLFPLFVYVFKKPAAASGTAYLSLFGAFMSLLDTSSQKIIPWGSFLNQHDVIAGLVLVLLGLIAIRIGKSAALIAGRSERRQQQAAEQIALQKKAEQERQAREKAEQERQIREKAEQERIAKEKAEQERRAREKAAAERRAKESAEEERKAKEKAEQERQAREKAVAERRAREIAEEERIAKEKEIQDLYAKIAAVTSELEKEKKKNSEEVVFEAGKCPVCGRETDATDSECRNCGFPVISINAGGEPKEIDRIKEAVLAYRKKISL